MNKILLGTLLFSSAGRGGRPSLRVRQGEGAADDPFQVCRMPDCAALDNELSALYPKAIAGFSPSSRRASAPSSAAGSKAQRLLEGRRPAPVRGRELLVADHRACR